MRTALLRLPLGVATLTLVLTGCGAAAVGPTPEVIYVTPEPEVSGSPSPAAVATSPSPAATPSQEEMRSAAAKGYLAAVGPANKAADALWKQYKNKTSLKAWRQYCTKLAAVVHTELEGLQAIKYPADTASDAKILIRAMAGWGAQLRACSNAPNWAAWNRAKNSADKANSRAFEAANLVRLDLGLPPVYGG